MACYPRELVENECQVKEQIPLLFGDMATMNTMGKQISGVSMSSDQIEAAPANSNRTETTHSTTVSDQSNVSILKYVSIFAPNEKNITKDNFSYFRILNDIHCIVNLQTVKRREYNAHIQWDMLTMNPQRRRL